MYTRFLLLLCSRMPFMGTIEPVHHHDSDTRLKSYMWTFELAVCFSFLTRDQIIDWPPIFAEVPILACN